MGPLSNSGHLTTTLQAGNFWETQQTQASWILEGPIGLLHSVSELKLYEICGQLQREVEFSAGTHVFPRREKCTYFGENNKPLKFQIENEIIGDVISEKLVENVVDDTLVDLNSGFGSNSDLNPETTTIQEKLTTGVSSSTVSENKILEKIPDFDQIENEITDEDDINSEKIVENMLDYALVNSISGFDSNSDLNLETTIIPENEILEKCPDFVLNDTTAAGKNPNQIVEQESNKENISEQGYIEEKSHQVLNETSDEKLVKEIKAKIHEKSEKIKIILKNRNKNTEIPAK